MDTETKEFIKSEIENLAQMITRSFDGLNERIDKRFDKVESDISEVKETAERIDQRTQN